MEMGIRFGDLVALTLYFMVTLFIGYLCSKRTTSTEGYFVGGRQVPGWAVGISMIGTSVSSVTFLAYPGAAFFGDWSKLVPGLMVPIAAAVAVFFFVPYFRRANLVSAYEYLEMRFGAWARAYGCLMWSLMMFFRMGIVLLLVSIAVQAISGLDIYTIIVVMGVLIVIYTMMGGIEAVIWTDVMQTIVLFFGGLICIAIVLFNIPESTGTALGAAWDADKFALTVSWDLSLLQETFWVLILFGLAHNLQEYISDQTRVQRYCAASTDAGAIRAVWVGALGCLPVWTIFMFVGTCLWIFYGAFPDDSVNDMAADQVFPYFILNELPVGVAGLVIAALLAAAMSSVDSALNGTATVLTSDIYRRFWVKGRDDSHYLRVARIITAVAGVVMIVVSCLLQWIIANDLIQKETILGMTFFFYAVLAAGIGGLFFLGFFTRRANSAGALAGIVCALFVTLFLTVTVNEDMAIVHRLLIGFFSNVAAFMVGYCVSLLFPAPEPRTLQNLTIYK